MSWATSLQPLNAIVVELLLRNGDVLAAMNLLIQWLSESGSVPLDSGGYSFFALLQGFEEWRKGRKKTPIPAARPAE